jgi:hypothetical protein
MNWIRAAFVVIELAPQWRMFMMREKHGEGRRCNVEVSGFVFGLMGFLFAASALGKIRRLEEQLKDAGVLK